MRKKALRVCCLVVTLISISSLIVIAAPQETRVSINGQQLQMNAQPVVKDGRTLVPLRDIFEALGLELQWDNATRTVNALKNGKTVLSLPIDSYRATVNGRKVNLDVPGQIIEGRTYIPVRFIAEATGSDVGWDAATKTVMVKAKPEFVVENHFSEDFGSCSLDGWTFYGGDWSLLRGDMRIRPDDKADLALAKDSSFSNFVYEATLINYTKNSSSNAGIVFRVSKPQKGGGAYNGYYAGLDMYNKTISLGKAKVGSAWTEIKTVSLQEDFNYGCTFKVVAKGSNIKLYLNDVLYIEVEDSTYESGAIGAATFKADAKYYNFFASELTDNDSEEVSGLYHNQIKYLAENTKKWATEKAQNGEVIGPTNRITLNNQALIDFANELTAGLENDREKTEAIYNWIIENIYYDYDSYTRHKVLYYDPIDVYTQKFTSCNGYSNLFATLMNISGIPCILVEGPTDQDRQSNYTGSHVWNEAYIDGRWVIFDSTWDTYNKYENGEFHTHAKWSSDYFDPTLEMFSKDHMIRSYFIETPQ